MAVTYGNGHITMTAANDSSTVGVNFDGRIDQVVWRSGSTADALRLDNFAADGQSGLVMASVANGANFLDRQQFPDPGKYVNRLVLTTIGGGAIDIYIR